VVARGVKRKRRGEGPEAAFSEAPEKGIRFKVKGSSFTVRLRPDFRKPGDVKAVGDGVVDGVLSVGGGEVYNSFRGGVTNHLKFGASRYIIVLKDAVSLAVVGRVAATMER
jgi:hypothetical protein